MNRPPSNIVVSDTAKTIVVNCTATVASGLSISTHWSINNYRAFKCDKKNAISFFSNGTMVIPDASRCDAGVYNCSAQHDGERISTSMRIDRYKGIYNIYTQLIVHTNNKRC